MILKIFFLAFIGVLFCQEAAAQIKRIIYKNRLPISFIGNQGPICPHHPLVLRVFEINVATRFKHYEDCIHFWTCQEFKENSTKLPMKHSCPYTRVFDPKKEKCVFYKYADPPCNKEFDYLDSRIIALYEESYNDEVFEEHQERVKQDKIQKEVGKKYQEQLQKKLIEDGRKAHEAGVQTQLDRQAQLHAMEEAHHERIHRVTRSIKITDQDWHVKEVQINPNAEFYLHDFGIDVKLESDGSYSCPPVKLRPGITEEMIRKNARLPHFQPANYYAIDSFYNGLESRFPVIMENGSLDCGSYLRCGWDEHAFGFNKAFLMTCRNRAFKPTKIKPYNDYFTFSIVKNTGMCVKNTEMQGDGLKHCLHLNKDVQEEDDVYYGLSEKPKNEEEEDIDIFKMIQDRYAQHEKFIDDYIEALEGEADPGLEDYPDANADPGLEDYPDANQGNTEDLKEFSPDTEKGSGGGEL